MACANCLDCFQTPATLHPRGKWASGWVREELSFLDLKTVADTCFFCRTILDGLEKRTAKDSPPLAITLKYLFQESWDDEDLALLSVTAHSGSILMVKYFLIEDVTQKTSLISSVRGHSTGSIEAMDFVKRQMQTCQESHISCPEISTSGQWFPTRLIELATTGPRLIVPGETQARGPYATLSHRWGWTKMFQCTKDSLEDLKKGLPTSALPRTFTEAFEMMKFLDIKYIWIDSLCIIQDSKEDWAREAQTMMTVYQRAFINFAATTASDSLSGMFRKRVPELLISDAFEIKNNFTSGTFKAVESLLDMEPWNTEIEASPLNTRGWVLQERLLSPRVIHFTPTQVIWDCAELTAPESTPSGALMYPKQMTTFIGRKPNSTLLRSKLTEDEALGHWATIINAYSRCHLSYNSDKLIAIRGVADYIGTFMNAKYICGLWRKNIELQLCWFTVGMRGFFSLSRNDGAPSWAWASINGPIETPQPHLYKDYEVNMLATVVDIRIQLQIDSEKVQRYTGSIQLRCLLTPVELQGGFDDPCLVGDGTEFVRRVEIDTPEDMKHKELYIVPVFDVRYDNDTTGKMRSSEVRGILLRIADDKSEVYLRCGHVGLFVSTDSDSGLFPSKWLSLVSGDEAHFNSKQLVTIV